MAQAQEALYAKQWLSEVEQEEDNFTSSSFAAALKAIAERNRTEQPEPAQPVAALKPATALKPAKAAALRITELEEDEEEEIEIEETRPRVKKQPALSRAWAWLKTKRVLRAEKQLRLSETLSLGEKRFVAILNVEGRKYLIGGGSNGVSLLTQLSGDANPAGLSTAAVGGKRA